MVARLLTETTKKDRVFSLDLEVRNAFNKLKQRFTTALVLATFDLERKTVLKTDASDFAIRACLGQINKEGQVQLVVYYS